MTVDDENDELDPRRQEGDADPTYRVGNKKPPLHTRFKRGRSGNPKGRPKGRFNFARVLMEELGRSVHVVKNGKPVKFTNDKLFAASLVKDAITKGPQDKALLLKAIQQLKADAAAAGAEARKKANEFGPVKEFSWSEEQQKLYEELGEVVKRVEQSERGGDEP
jgi:hypothetical protein